MPGRRSRSAWTTGLLAATTLASGLATAAPATALQGTVVKDETYAFTAKINVADEQACSGVLVDPQWVLSTKSCFANGGKPVQAGKPTSKTTITVGRTNLTQKGGKVVEAVELVPHPDRDVVMVKLARRALGIAPARLAATAPTAGEQLTVAGFGRTKAQWVPDKLHSSAFTVGSITGSAVNLNGSAQATICQGDAGGPALRVKDGIAELVAVNSRSWQGGCLGTDAKEKRTDAVDVRVDDLSEWIRKTAFRVQDDVTSDGIADLAGIWADGTLHLYPGDPAKGLSGENITQPGGNSWKTIKQVAKGDFTNDGIADLMAVWGDGTLHLYKGDGKGKFSKEITVTQGGSTWGTVKQLTAGDYDGDGIADLMAVWTDGALHLYKGKGNGQINSQVKVNTGGDTWGTVKLLPGGDFNGDGIADLMAVWYDGTLHYYPGDGTGQVGKQVPVPVGGSTWGTVRQLTAGDFNGDGIADLMAIWTDGTLHLYKGDGKGGINTATSIPFGGSTWKTMLQLA
ncbi:FG-GAP-like repeat-containing protein [Streptomyces halobius]|uniref:FG-GAP-like repeat-containing protein n=1 Tax=Streptomyces halobius TaxID=2879846 RepID=A0ABY4M9L4_9ACTN|nr:FG-GAP-like repeat-containing protein [Streptomyces halobius]UQA94476.1 FG-GAP-like repeat-containing protein [Streptomyces halobius]